MKFWTNYKNKNLKYELYVFLNYLWRHFIRKKVSYGKGRGREEVYPSHEVLKIILEDIIWSLKD